MTEHRIVKREEWQTAREELLRREKEHTRIGDELSRQRRELPWVRVEKEYRFDTGEGTRTLGNLLQPSGHSGRARSRSESDHFSTTSAHTRLGRATSARVPHPLTPAFPGRKRASARPRLVLALIVQRRSRPSLGETAEFTRTRHSGRRARRIQPRDCRNAR